VKISELPFSELKDQLKTEGLNFQTGPFAIRLQTQEINVVRGLQELYGDFPVCQPDVFVDFHITLKNPSLLRRWIRPQVVCLFDGEAPFPPLSTEQAYPLLETCLNWYIYAEVYNFLIIHAGAVEKNGYAAILPGKSGAGKSTLTSALVNRGWRLLTDELTLISLTTNEIIPLARPVSLKNQSITILKQFEPNVCIGGKCDGTAKGTVAYMRPPADSVARVHERPLPKYLIFPRYKENVSLSMKPIDKTQAFIHLSDGLVNYAVIGLSGFNSLTKLIEASNCYELTYSDLNQAISCFDELMP